MRDERREIGVGDAEQAGAVARGPRWPTLRTRGRGRDARRGCDGDESESHGVLEKIRSMGAKLRRICTPRRSMKRGADDIPDRRESGIVMGGSETMIRRLPGLGACLWLACVAFAVGRQAPVSSQGSNAPIPPAASPDLAPYRATLDQDRVTCHNARLKTGGLVLDGLDLATLSDDAELWEKVVRKLRAGVMPPQGVPTSDEPRRSTRFVGVARSGPRSRRGGASRIRAGRCCIA